MGSLGRAGINGHIVGTQHSVGVWCIVGAHKRLLCLLPPFPGIRDAVLGDGKGHRS